MTTGRINQVAIIEARTLGRREANLTEKDKSHENTRTRAIKQRNHGAQKAPTERVRRLKQQHDDRRERPGTTRRRHARRTGRTTQASLNHSTSATPATRRTSDSATRDDTRKKRTRTLPQERLYRQRCTQRRANAQGRRSSCRTDWQRTVKMTCAHRVETQAPHPGQRRGHNN